MCLKLRVPFLFRLKYKRAIKYKNCFLQNTCCSENANNVPMIFLNCCNGLKIIKYWSNGPYHLSQKKEKCIFLYPKEIYIYFRNTNLIKYVIECTTFRKFIYLIKM